MRQGATTSDGDGRERPSRTVNRRAFLTVLGGASLSWPKAAQAFAREVEGGGAQDDEAFWGLVRSRFAIPSDRIYLNNGTLGSPPRVVVDAVAEHARRVARTFPPGVAWDDVKGSVSALVGGDPEGFVFPRNTTEATSMVAHGLALGPGDEIVSTDHEHIGGVEAWKMVAARRGAVLSLASLPVPPRSGSDLVDALWSAVTPRTRVVAVSHMTFTTGTLLPVDELASRCAREGIVLSVDGAHPPGMLALDLGQVGGDFYASSPHKWMLAPQGTGLLYLSPRWRETLWPTVVSGGWDDRSLGAHRLNHMGTIDESRLAGLLAASEFLLALGMQRVEGRIRHLRRLAETGLAGIPGVELQTPESEPLKGGMVSFSVSGVESSDLQRHLSRVANVRTRVIGEYEYGWMRLSFHVYNSPAEIGRVLDVVEDVARNGIPG